MFENFEYKDLLFGDSEVDAATESTQEVARQPDTGTPDDGTPTPDPSTPTPDPSTPTPDPSTPTPDPSTPTPEDETTTTAGDSGPGFTALSGAAAVLGSALVWLHKRGDGEE
jgi:penicillin amidase